MPRSRIWQAGAVQMPPKDPEAILDYQEDWSQWLATGETLSTATWTVPTGITEVSTALGSTSATIWLSEGTAGTSYEIECKVTTTASRTDVRRMSITVNER